MIEAISRWNPFSPEARKRKEQIRQQLEESEKAGLRTKIRFLIYGIYGDACTLGGEYRRHYGLQGPVWLSEKLPTLNRAFVLPPPKVGISSICKQEKLSINLMSLSEPREHESFINLSFLGSEGNSEVELWWFHFPVEGPGEALVSPVKNELTRLKAIKEVLELMYTQRRSQ